MLDGYIRKRPPEHRRLFALHAPSEIPAFRQMSLVVAIDLRANDHGRLGVCLRSARSGEGGEGKGALADAPFTFADADRLMELADLRGALAPWAPLLAVCAGAGAAGPTRVHRSATCDDGARAGPAGACVGGETIARRCTGCSTSAWTG